MRKVLVQGGVLALAAFSISACSESNEMASPANIEQSASDPQALFWDAMAQQCGQAFAGERTVERPGREMLEGDEELIVHFRECEDNVIKAPFHIGKADGHWDRSRTWIYTRHEDRLELDHDHRESDGSHSEETGYGGFTVEPGSADRQLFIYTQRTGEQGEVLGWRIEIVPGKRYTYGTMADGDWTWRLDFDLTQPVAAPPTPWGHE